MGSGAKPTPATRWLRAAIEADPLRSNQEIADAAIAAGHTGVHAKRVSNERYKVNLKAKPKRGRPRKSPPPVAAHVARNRVKALAFEAKSAIRVLIVQLGAAAIHEIVDELLNEAKTTK